MLSAPSSRDFLKGLSTLTGPLCKKVGFLSLIPNWYGTRPDL